MPQMKGLKGFTVSSIATIASGRPYTGVFDTGNVNFSIVPGEGFNSFRGPGVRDLDLSVARSFRLNERLGLKFRIEAFNLLNHAILGQVSGNNPVVNSAITPAGGNFGYITTFGATRSLQFSGRFNF